MAESIARAKLTPRRGSPWTLTRQSLTPLVLSISRTIGGPLIPTPAGAGRITTLSDHFSPLASIVEGLLRNSTLFGAS